MLKVAMPPSTPKSPAAKEKPAKLARQAKAEGPAKAKDQTGKAAARPARPAAKGANASAAKLKPAPKLAAKPAGKPGTDMVRLKDIIESVAAATGQKKPEAKKAVEATLSAIGAALAQKSILALPPLGKLRVAKASAGVMTLKLRLAGATKAKGLALADDDEDS